MSAVQTNRTMAPLSDADRTRLERFLPIRVVIRRHADGTLEGLTEESWNLNWSANRVNIFWSGKAYSILGETTLDGVADAKHNCKASRPDLFTPEELVIDPLTQDSPIAIDWVRWLNATTSTTNATPILCSQEKKHEHRLHRKSIVHPRGARRT